MTIATPAPTTATAPRSEEVLITQDATFTFSGPLPAYTAEMALAYNVGYGIQLAIYDTVRKAFLAGCSVTSRTVASRRSELKIQYTATVAAQQATAAEGQARVATPSSLLAAVTQSEQLLTAEGRVPVNSVAVPSNVEEVHAPAVQEGPSHTQVGTENEEEGGGMAIALIVGIGVGVLLIICCAAAAMYMLFSGGNAGLAAQDSLGAVKGQPDSELGVNLSAMPRTDSTGGSQESVDPMSSAAFNGGHGGGRSRFDRVGTGRST